MEQHGTINAWTLDEFIDEEIGMKGSFAREEFDREVEKKVKAIEKKNYHIVMPRILHNAISAKASELGQSISAYITSIMERELQMA